MNSEKPSPEPNKRRWPFGYGEERECKVAANV